MCMAGVAPHEDPVVERVFVDNALSDRIHGEPFDPLPVNCVRPENLLGGRLYFFCGHGLAGAEVRVGRGGDLDIETDHVVFSGDYHDGAVIGVDGALHLVNAVSNSERL